MKQLLDNRQSKLFLPQIPPLDGMPPGPLQPGGTQLQDVAFASDVPSCPRGTIGLELVGTCTPKVYVGRMTSWRDEQATFASVVNAGRLKLSTASQLAESLLPDMWLPEAIEFALVAAVTTDRAELRPKEPEGLRKAAPSTVTNHEAADELRQFLAVTWAQLESITGISEQTFYDWGRTPRDARPSTLRKLRRVAALVRALSRHMGQSGAKEWLHAGHPSALDQMIAGEIGEVEAAAGRLLPSAKDAWDTSLEAYAPDPASRPKVAEEALSKPIPAAKRRRRPGVRHSD